jgi:hypothetical protein
MANLHFVTFGDGSPQTRGAAIRLRRQAIKSSIFTTVKAYNLKLLRDEFPSFWAKHEEFLLSNRRGLGYFLWKPFLLSSTLAAMEENDFLMYADAGCEIISNETVDLLDLFPTEPNVDLAVVPLEAHHTNERWTNKRCCSHFHNARRFTCLPQMATTFFFVRNTKRARAFGERWLELSVVDDCSNLIDRPGSGESKVFEAHRHDQSIFSFLAYEWESRGDIGLRRIDIGRTQSDRSAIRGVRNRTPFRSIGWHWYTRIPLAKCYSAFVKVVKCEQRYRSTLTSSR